MDIDEDAAAELSPTEAAFMRAYTNSVRQNLTLFKTVGLLMAEDGLKINEQTHAAVLAAALVEEQELFDMRLAAVVERGSFRIRKQASKSVEDAQLLLRIVRSSFYKSLRVNAVTKQQIDGGWCSGNPLESTPVDKLNAPASLLSGLAELLGQAFGAAAVHILSAELHNASPADTDDDYESDDTDDDSNWQDL